MRTIIPPPLQGLLIGVAMWLVALGLPMLAAPFPGYKYLAALLFMAGAIIEIIAILTFIRRKTTVNPMTPSNASVLVVNGLYRFSRNPMYLALLLVLAGWALWLGNAANVALVAVFFWYITEYQIKPEEAALKEKFGDEYEQYRKRVRRWI